MRHLDKIGFALCLVGTAGAAESYGLNRSLAISLILIITGGIMIFVGDLHNDIHRAKRTDNRKHRNYDSNVLDRLYFLCQR